MYIVFLVGISVLGVFLAILKPLPVKVVIDNVLIGDQLYGAYKSVFDFFSIYSREGMLWFSISLLAGITVLSSILSYLTVNYTAKLGMRLLFELSEDLYAKLQRLSLNFYAKQKMGDIIQRITGDAFVVYLLAAQITLPIITSLFTFFAMFYIMATIDLTLAVIAISVIPILGLVLVFMSKKLNDTTQQQYQKQGDLAAFLHESLSSIKIVQAFVREKFMFLKLQDRAHNYESAYLKAIRTGEVYKQYIAIITGIASAALVGLGAYKGLHGDVSAGELYIFLGYLAALYGPVNSLSTAIGTAISFGARGKRVLEILDSPEVVLEKANALPITNTKGSLSFKNVFFRYREANQDILKDISFDIEGGKTIAIIGPTGAGKTTLISLLSRFHDPTAGEILLDGKPLTDFKLHSLREAISLVLQEPFLFPMSIGENIAFGNPDASEYEIEKAAKLAEAHEFIMALPQGYHTQVAEAGTSLSGGEKQRICLARAFLKKSPIMILDEPTSALDALTESRIFERLSNHTAGRTVILISHRLSTIKHADEIFILDKGSIVETGKHSQLVANGGLYADLYQHQHIGV